jgi:L-ascorbate metabolism protein UlaG (beta-lactamase superfamily)
MQLTKFGHSCIRVDDGDRTLVVDPGAFSDLDPALDGADAVVITHGHPDHLDAGRLRAAAQADPRLRIWAPAAVAADLVDLGEQIVGVGPDETFEAAGFSLQTFGGQHAVIHPLIPIIANLGVLIDGAVYHPGDSFAVPTAPVSTLLLPVQAPWSKVSEVIDFAVAVRAARAYPIHDGIVAPAYHGILGNSLAPITARYGIEYRPLDDTVDA